MVKRIVWLTLSCLIVVTLVLTSCGPAEEEEEEEAKTVVGEVEEEEEEEEEEVVAPEVEGPTYGGTLTIIRNTPLTAFDEGFGFPWATQALSYTNEELFSGNWALGLSGTKEVTFQTWGISGLTGAEPRLCESYEVTFQDDTDTLIYNIRKGVYWHDKYPVNGREMNANDIVYNMERGLRLPRSYLNITMTQDERPTSIEAVDKWTVKVVCPKGLAGKWLEQSGELMAIIPPEVDEEWGDMNDWTRVIGTGPFTIEDYVPMSSCTFKRNPNYWRDDPVHPGNQLPYVDYLKMLIIEDASTRIAALRTGKVDTMKMSYDDAEDVIATTTDLIVSAVPATTPGLFFMDLRKPPFDNIKVRRAMQIGVDQKAISDSYYSGHAEWYSFPLLPIGEHSDMWTDLDDMPESVQELFGYDVDKAKALLTEAGYPNGFKTKVTCYNAAETVDMVAIFVDYWDKIGVEVEIDAKEYSIWNSIITAKSYEGMAVRGLSGSSTAHKLYTYRGCETGPVENLSFVCDPLMDDTYKEMLDNYFDKPKFRGLFRDLVPYILDQVWMIQMPAAHGYCFWWPWLKGFNGEYTVGYYDIDNWPPYVWIDQDLKKEMGY